ncbi:uncharacterized protein LOC113293257 [Papaver somniferum]|uniref:uncharacterized protein LOC113293257 n=1 Tax=Papaver somniferum TaxID=3469 RepID=UPI000E6F7D11|nr:uncharacterized protein LOC113293257 [Papaver somniferum]
MTDSHNDTSKDGVSRDDISTDAPLRNVRSWINVDFTTMEESLRGGESISEDYMIILNDVQSPAVSLESNTDEGVDKNIIMDKQHIDEAHSSLRNGETEDPQNPQPNGGSNAINGDFNIVEPPNDLETPQVSIPPVTSSYKYEIVDL